MSREDHMKMAGQTGAPGVPPERGRDDQSSGATDPPRADEGTAAEPGASESRSVRTGDAPAQSSSRSRSTESDAANEPPGGRPVRARTPAEIWDEDEEAGLPRPRADKYTAPGSGPGRAAKPSSGGHVQRGDVIAFMLLAGIALGAGIGWGIDRLAGTFPGFMIVGVFAGFGLALYAVFIETR